MDLIVVYIYLMIIIVCICKAILMSVFAISQIAAPILCAKICQSE